MEKLKFKIAILGEPEVGKSTLNNFCSQRFDKNLEALHEQIFGVSFAVKILKNVDVKITLVVWSFTGQDRYRSLRPQYIKGVAGILLLFDLTRRETFEKLKEWIKFLEKSKSRAPIILLGNKADLFEEKKVSDKEIESFINNNLLQGYYEISLKTGLNVEPAIIRLAELVYQFMKTGVKVPVKVKINRFENKPLKADNLKFFEQFLITLDEISKTIFNEISDKITKLPKVAEVTKISQILKEISSYDVKIKKLFEELPISIPADTKEKLLKDWELKKEELVSKLKNIKVS
ncbi:MAG: Rab family GTPase [Candidatus Helarchaeota archaeon]